MGGGAGQPKMETSLWNSSSAMEHSDGEESPCALDAVASRGPGRRPWSAGDDDANRGGEGGEGRRIAAQASEGDSPGERARKRQGETRRGAASDAARGARAQANARAATDVVSHDKPGSGREGRVRSPQGASAVAGSMAPTAHDTPRAHQEPSAPKRRAPGSGSSAVSRAIRSRICLEGHTAVLAGEVKPEAPVA